MKIGIVTLYKNSVNFGGLLQAKALVQALKNMGHQAEQIDLGEFSTAYKSRGLFSKIHEHGIKYAAELLYGRLRSTKSHVTIDASQSIQRCGQYRQSIPHTSRIDEDDLAQLNDVFDLFITGSDQVWNPKWMRSVYLLDFATKKKISYAASIARYDFSRFEKNMLQNAVKTFHWVSVREASAVDFLQRECNVKADHVLDPTMLITAEQWEQDEEPVDVQGKYVFCYFLKQTAEKRKYAQEFAKKYDCQIIYPVFNGMFFDWNDAQSQERMIYETGPREFLYLLHHADYVLTDSFHGTVFSVIYQRPFSHLLRESTSFAGNMNSRIHSLLKSFDLETTIKACTDTPDWNDIDYQNTDRILREKREKSLQLLRNAIEQ